MFSSDTTIHEPDDDLFNVAMYTYVCWRSLPLEVPSALTRSVSCWSTQVNTTAVSEDAPPTSTV